MYPRRWCLRQHGLYFESQRLLNSISHRRIQRAFNDLLISLPGGRTLPPPLGHVFRFHICQGDAELIMQLVTQMTFCRRQHAFSFLEALGTIRFAGLRQGVDRCLDPVIRIHQVLTLHGLVFQLGVQGRTQRILARFDVSPNCFGVIYVLRCLNPIPELIGHSVNVCR